MTGGPRVPWTTRLGTIGESQIWARLSYVATVNKYNVDTGLDFHCELIQGDSPTIPFYVQAKGTTHFDDQWAQSIPKSTLLYWLRQPAPVYLVVYDEVEGTCYWMSIEQMRYRLRDRIFESTAETVRVTVDRSQVLASREVDGGYFVETIKADYVLTQLSRGQALLSGEGYVRQLPHVPRAPEELKRLRESIRMGLYSLVQHQMALDEYEGALLCCEFLAKFDHSHYNHLVWLAQLQARFGNPDAARASYQDALDICERDKQWPRDSMARLVDNIRREMSELPVGGEPGD